MTKLFIPRLESYEFQLDEDEQLSAGEAKTHLGEGIKALQSGDTNSAMTHVKAAESALTGS
jgi:hypothetical protein